MQDPNLIQELKKAFSLGVENGVIDLERFLASRSSFNILRLEDLYSDEGGKVPPYRRTDTLILFVKKGNGQRSISHYTFPIGNNSMAVIPSHVIHAATYFEKPYGYVITFNPDFFLQQAFPYKLLNSKRVLKPSLQPFLVLTQDQAVEVITIFESIIEECNSGFEEKKQMIALKLLQLLILCDRFFASKAISEKTFGYSETMEVLNGLIETNFRQHREVQFYAEALHMHPNNLNLIVKKVTRLTTKQTITNRVIIEAKYLLVSTTLTIKEIAYELGFEDANYFNSFFKKDQHTTPAQYRNLFM
jgi:AraC family transcriptional regulator, transcriptional activator of pobA